MPTQPRLPKIELGKCPFCEKEIMKLDEKNQPVRLPGYATFWVLLSDESRMKVLICEDCKKTLTQAKVDDLITAHQNFWKQGINDSTDRKIQELKNQRDSQINYYTNLTSLKFGLSERDLE